MGTILSDLGLESSLVASMVTAHIKDGGVTVTGVEHDDAKAERLTGLDVQAVKAGAELRKAREQLVADQTVVARAAAGDAAVEKV